MIMQAVKWVGGVDGYLEFIDQRKLPGELTTLKCRDTKQVFEAIKTLAVRGAPAIGVAAGFGLVLALRKSQTLQHALSQLRRASDHLASSRPTAVNLFWALERVKRCAEQFIAENPRADIEQLQKVVLAEADAIFREDVDMCRRIGENGERFIKEGAGVLTHCNAGALATAGQGTALSILYEAKKRGKHFKVYADESRPLLQGSRLTAWELKKAGIDVTVICDSMAAALMSQGKIDVVIVGADRIAANGDTANKIGTYGLSVLARHHDIPFYIAAPSSTFDLKTSIGKDIPIEQRSADEIRFCGGRRVSPDGVDIYNPAFDVTPAKNISAIITDKGVIEKPNARKMQRHFANSG
jgi:methylthioribose-1-phosphate isomerase